METLLFNDLPVSPEIRRALEGMHFVEATPIQAKAIPALLQGADITAEAPTGTGKTGAFGIPLVEGIDADDPSIQALVLCPTRELVVQTALVLRNISRFCKGVRTLAIYGGEPISRQIFGLKKRPQIIIATPGRIMDHINRRTVRLDSLRTLVLDEADRMLDMGFREDLDVILKTIPQQRQTALFSATFSPDILQIAREYQQNAVRIRIPKVKETAPSIEQFYLEMRSGGKEQTLFTLLGQRSFTRTLVFCNTKRMVDALTNSLRSGGYRAEALHGDMPQRRRDSVMRSYRGRSVDILVATDVAARGIDVNDIEAVINYDLPMDDEYYVHRIGRTGRARKSGVAYTFVYSKEMPKLRAMMRRTKTVIKGYGDRLQRSAQGMA